MSPYLFVYGTLLRRSPHPMARFLAERARFEGLARVRGRLYDLGRYPGMTEPIETSDWVEGELYDLGAAATTLEDLDAYEKGESPLPAFFDRQRAEATRPDGTQVPIWIYWYRGAIEEHQRIASGRYEITGERA